MLKLILKLGILVFLFNFQSVAWDPGSAARSVADEAKKKADEARERANEIAREAVKKADEAAKAAAQKAKAAVDAAKKKYKQTGKNKKAKRKAKILIKKARIKLKAAQMAAKVAKRKAKKRQENAKKRGKKNMKSLSQKFQKRKKKQQAHKQPEDEADVDSTPPLPAQYLPNLDADLAEMNFTFRSAFEDYTYWKTLQDFYEQQLSIMQHKTDEAAKDEDDDNDYDQEMEDDYWEYMYMLHGDEDDDPNDPDYMLPVDQSYAKAVGDSAKAWADIAKHIQDKNNLARKTYKVQLDGNEDKATTAWYNKFGLKKDGQKVVPKAYGWYRMYEEAALDNFQKYAWKSLTDPENGPEGFEAGAHPKKTSADVRSFLKSFNTKKAKVYPLAKK